MITWKEVRQRFLTVPKIMDGREMKKVLGVAVCFVLAFAFLSAKAIGRAQEVCNEKCPVMGGKVDSKFFTEYQGKKIFCCKMCVPKFKKNPEKYLGKLPQFAKDDELEKLGAELRVVLKKIAEREKTLHGEAAGREMCKLLMKEMKSISKETGISKSGMVGCCGMHKEMMAKNPVCGMEEEE